MVATNKKVLVVDDEKIVCESYKLALTDAGYDVRTVQSGREAIQACRVERFDVMLADIKMPDMDGLEVARVVLREFPDLRVVVITGYPSQESAEEAAKLGIFDYLEKPLSPQGLSAATAAALARFSGRTTTANPEAAAAAPTSTRRRERVPAKPETAAEPVGQAARSNVARQAVLVAVGFLAGVMVAYVIAPVHSLAYLLVGTAIASGTLLGLFADTAFGKRAAAEAPRKAEHHVARGAPGTP